MAKKTNEQILEKIANELLSLMGSKALAKVSKDSENEALVVEIDGGEETGLLIGRHGETLLAIQAALGMMLKEKSGEWIRVLVNVGDWREKQEEGLKSLARQASERAKETGEPQPLYNLTAAQRRIIHLELSQDPDIVTESQGEDKERFLLVKPKK